MIPIIDNSERVRIEGFAKVMGLENPVNDRFLRMEKGACVFLGADNLCSIHKKYGAAQKPTVCRQFPLVATQTETDVRVSVDPSCYTAMSTWRTGTPVPDQPLVAATVNLSKFELDEEEKVLRLIARAKTTAGLLGLMAGSASRKPKAPSGFTENLIELVQNAKLSDLLKEPDMGRAFASSIESISRVEAVQFKPTAASPSKSRERWAIETTHRIVWLRLTPNIPTVRGVALLTLAGAMLAHWLSETDSDYALFLAGWIRALRSPLFVSRLVPNADALRRLSGVGKIELIRVR
jgi:Fe-S-cluster containining protein